MYDYFFGDVTCTDLTNLLLPNKEQNAVFIYFPDLFLCADFWGRDIIYNLIFLGEQNVMKHRGI